MIDRKKACNILASTSVGNGLPMVMSGLPLDANVRTTSCICPFFNAFFNLPHIYGYILPMILLTTYLDGDFKLKQLHFY